MLQSPCSCASITTGPKARWAALAAASLVTLAAASASAEPELVYPAPGTVIAVPCAPACDEPGGSTCALPAPCSSPVAVAMPVQPALRPPWQLRVSLGVQSGIAAGETLFNPTVSGPFVGGDLRLLWSRQGKHWGLGLRLGVAKGLHMRSEAHSDWALFGESEHEPAADADMLSVGASFLLQTYGFWFFAGPGVTHFSYEDDHDDGTFPEIHLGVGYDIPLGDHLALRLHATAATFFVSYRGEAGGGLVVRF